MAAHFYIGPAGWSYPDWDGIVYPRGTERGTSRLALMARWFNLVEVDSTFYRLPPLEWAGRWLDAIPAERNFRFVIKLHRNLTHDRQLDPPALAHQRNFLKPFREAGRLGYALAQFPWSFRCDAPNKRFLRDLLDAMAGFPLAVEVRHGSWDLPAFFGYLRERGVAFCNIDQPVIGDSLGLTRHVTAPAACLRLHGRNYGHWFQTGGPGYQRYNYLYSDSEIALLAKTAREMGEQAEEVYIVTNNHYRGKAVFNGGQLGRMLSDEVPGCPDLTRGQVE